MWVRGAVCCVFLLAISACGDGENSQSDGGGDVATKPDPNTSRTCGNGTLESGEFCDTAITSGTGACPDGCDDGDGCTVDRLVGTLCTQHCEHDAITRCSAQSDGCCPAECTAQNDADCKAETTCGNGVLDEGELCDSAIPVGLPGACPLSCDDGNACTRDVLSGGPCQAHCENTAETTCSGTASDGCCPAGCDNTNDADCSVSCGNGVIEKGETCDTGIAAGQAGACPQDCDDKIACTTDTMVGSGCNVTCAHAPVQRCDATNSDGCCPQGCNSGNDIDCSPGCGNGVLDTNETCDTVIPPGQAGACPQSCDDKIACTRDTFVGAGCTIACSNAPITSCGAAEGCCPTGCDATNDPDCLPSCGNGIVEQGETCDTGIAAGQPGACPASCDDHVACTADQLVGSGCTVACSNTQITSCSAARTDGCCPAGCDANSDVDCSPSCGNGVVESGEQCDTAIQAGQTGACPTRCDDNDSCTRDRLVGAACSAQCSNSAITSCDKSQSDGCCPPGCDQTTDADCQATCGNGVVEAGEACDTRIISGPGSCPASCPDRGCQKGTLSGSDCAAACSYRAETQCSGTQADGCCPSGCNATNDADCQPSCGNGVLEGGELCDTGISTGNGACPRSCPQNGCSMGSLVGSGCLAQCNYRTVTTCSSTSDGCCPTTCNANNDPDCQASCGNGVVESGELCDSGILSGSGSCPQTCPDNGCQMGTLTGSGCSAQCTYRTETTCSGQTADGCCPASCNANNDADCAASCGNGVLEPGEQCDTGISSGNGACPRSCPNNGCSKGTLSGTACAARCTYNTETRCSATSDSCCPTGCNANNDADCTPACGNGVLESGERCDTAITSGTGTCPGSCPDQGCRKGSLTGSGCTAECTYRTETTCSRTPDSCCPAACNAVNDADCAPVCGNGVLESGERCDTGITGGAGACPLSCPNSGCRMGTLSGSGCGAECSYRTETRCSGQASDGCCPAGCNANTDVDCQPVCGNGVLETGEQCDTGIGSGIGVCPSRCPQNGCNFGTLTGSGCSAQCSYHTETACGGARATDGCCPAGCNSTNDGDCQPVCGNGIVEAGETCDSAISSGPGACPASCPNDGCRFGSLVGQGCTRECRYATQTQCSAATADGCCPTGCDANSDTDCSAVCGNGVLEPGEQCDSGITSGPGVCPVRCPNNGCSFGTLSGTGCAAQCTYATQTICSGRTQDGCCPAGCNANTDADCRPVCGNGVVESGEQCDTAITGSARGACPSSCPNNGCSFGDLTGSGCSAHCVYTTQSQCSGSSQDGCCPADCNALNDADCPAVCGNGVVEPGEQCDTSIASGPGACPARCPSTGCRLGTLTGTGCSVQCMYVTQTQCSGATTQDGCCPAGCNATNDADCQPACGNGVVEPGETCDVNITGGQGACPTSCPTQGCLVGTLTGQGCTAECVFRTITSCEPQISDGCCPAGCNALEDVDCQPVCGNGVLEPGERCDPKIPVGAVGACPTDCPSSGCNINGTLTGSGCNVTCSYTQQTQCSGRTFDGCCPTRCTELDDADCARICGNAIVEPNEKCDIKIGTGQPGACPRSCPARQCQTATIDQPNTCQAECVYTDVACSVRSSDGCCPSGCTALNDVDCQALQCQKAICGVRDGCCPAGCTALRDTDCDIRR